MKTTPAKIFALLLSAFFLVLPAFPSEFITLPSGEKICEEAYPLKGGYNLDLSVESLNELEEMILKMNVDENHALFDDIASYIGQVVVENYGGKWECCLDKNNSLYYGFPVIAGFNNYDVLLSPYSVLKIFIHRKKSGQIFHSIDICINPPAFDF